MLYGLLWKIHAILMGLSLISMTAGITVSLVFRGKKPTFQIHKKLGITASAAGLAALIIAFVMVQTSSGYHLAVPHAVLGAAVSLLFIITPLLMIIKGWRKNKRFRSLHRLLGFVTAVLMIITIISGLRLTGLIVF